MTVFIERHSNSGISYFSSMEFLLFIIEMSWQGTPMYINKLYLLLCYSFGLAGKMLDAHKKSRFDFPQTECQLNCAK